jgi:hypothetical protein
MTTEAPSKAEIRQTRRLRALQLRLAGSSYRQIAAALGTTHPTAIKDVDAMLREYAEEPAEKVRSAEAARLDRLLLAHWPAAILGNLKATDTVLQIMARRAALLGLDAPRKVDITTWIREQAVAEGLDPDRAVEDADAFVRGLPA